MSLITRVILHLDLDAFFCAVEEQRDPTLKGLPFAVGGKPDKRGVVASCSYAARKFGVHSAMPMATAVRLCPELIIISHHFSDYRIVSKQVMEKLNQLTPLVEQISIDEAFLDVTGIQSTPRAIAKKLQAEINHDLDLSCSLGVATNKFVAKTANNIGKRQASKQTNQPPNAILVIEPGNEAGFLAPLQINELWGVGPKTADKLRAMNIHTIGDLAKRTESEMQRRFGKIGIDITRRAKGIDDRAVTPEHDAKSISKEITFSIDTNNADNLTQTIRHLSEGVGRQVRKSKLQGRTVTIKLRWGDFTTLSRQITLPQPIDQDREIFDTAIQIFERIWRQNRPIRLIGVGISGFDTQAKQLSLWETTETKQNQQLQSTLDDLRDRFGDTMIKRGSDLKLDEK